MTLKELINSIHDEKLSKEKLEEYRDSLCYLYSLLELEMADIEKAKAIYFLDFAEKTDKATERKWAVTEKGQREIEVKHYLRSAKEMISSAKSRLYSLYTQ